MPSFEVEVVIRNKKVARDPEAETIYKELISRSKFKDAVLSLRSGKWFLFSIEARDERSALEIAKELCKELRIFNPVIHEMEVRLYKGSGTQVPGY